MYNERSSLHLNVIDLSFLSHLRTGLAVILLSPDHVSKGNFKLFASVAPYVNPYLHYYNCSADCMCTLSLVVY